MNVYLEVSHNKANIKRVVLKKTAVLGRSKECNLRIASTQVSRRHCQVTVENDAVFVMDLKSSNGTFLNGKPLPANQRVQVASGSELAIGPARFVFRFDEPSDVIAKGDAAADGRTEGETSAARSTETVGDTMREDAAPDDFLGFLAASADTVEATPDEFPELGNGSAVGQPMPRFVDSEPDSSPSLQEAADSFESPQETPPESFEIDLGDDIDDASASDIAAFKPPVAEAAPPTAEPVVAEPAEDAALEETLEGFSLSDEAEEPTTPPPPAKKSKAPQPKPAKKPTPAKSDDQVAFDFLNDAGGEPAAAEDSSLGDFFSQFDNE